MKNKIKSFLVGCALAGGLWSSVVLTGKLDPNRCYTIGGAIPIYGRC